MRYPVFIDLFATVEGILMVSTGTEVIAKPSEVLSSVRAMMDVLQTLENYVHIDVSRIFNNVLLQQTQPTDGFTGEHTITHVSVPIIHDDCLIRTNANEVERVCCIVLDIHQLVPGGAAEAGVCWSHHLLAAARGIRQSLVGGETSLQCGRVF